MAILINEDTTVSVQGITGREGQDRTRFMLDYWIKVLFGVTPGRGGVKVWGVSVYNKIKEGIEIHGMPDVSVTFVPGPQVKEAVFEAIEAGVKFIVVPTERVPFHDILEILALARKKGTLVLGPGSLGLISPGKAVIGWLGGNEEFAKEIFKPGPVGIISRSGGQTSTPAWWTLNQVGVGVSTAVHVGSESPVGLSFAELLPLFEKDEQTELVFCWCERGTKAEQEAAGVIKEGGFTKPLVAYVAGKGLPADKGSFSHASNLIEGEYGTVESKIKALTEAGAYVVENPRDIAEIIGKILKR